MADNTERALLIEVATKIYCAGMSFSGLDYLAPKEAVGLATDLIRQVDVSLNPPAG